jgi:hypothetical protein
MLKDYRGAIWRSLNRLTPSLMDRISALCVRTGVDNAVCFELTPQLAEGEANS